MNYKLSRSTGKLNGGEDSGRTEMLRPSVLSSTFPSCLIAVLNAVLNAGDKKSQASLLMAFNVFFSYHTCAPIGAMNFQWLKGLKLDWRARRIVVRAPFRSTGM